MKLKLNLCFLLLISFNSFSQIGYDLEVRSDVKDSLLRLHLSIKNSSTELFQLGGSTFLLDLPSDVLDLKGAKFYPGDFDATSDKAYENAGTATDKLLILNVKPQLSNGLFPEKWVSGERLSLGEIEIPVLDPCHTVIPKWYKDAVILKYSKEAKAEDITSGATYKDGTATDLDGGISKTIPDIIFKEGKLVSSSPLNNQWFVDGALIPGADKQEFTPLLQGNYAVQVSYPCAKNLSAEMPVFITGLKEFSAEFNFNAQPNPFEENCKIKYSLVNGGNVKLQVLDLSGTHITDLVNTYQSAGDNEINFRPSKHGMNAGTFILKLSVNGRAGTIKLVALK